MRFITPVMLHEIGLGMIGHVWYLLMLLVLVVRVHESVMLGLGMPTRFRHATVVR